MDNQLRIRRATPRAQKILNIRPIDTGRPIAEINLNMDIPEFEELLYDSIDDLTTNEMEIQDKDNKWYCLKIRPYRTHDRRVNEAVLTFIDIDSIRAAELNAKHLETIMSSTDEAVVIIGDNGKILGWNQSAERFYGHEKAKAKGERLDEIVKKDENSELWALIENAKLGKDTKVSEAEVKTNDSESRRLNVSVYPLEYNSGLVNEIIIIAKEPSRSKRQPREKKP